MNDAEERADDDDADARPLPWGRLGTTAGVTPSTAAAFIFLLGAVWIVLFPSTEDVASLLNARWLILLLGTEEVVFSLGAGWLVLLLANNSM